jgi:hypothetical protein
LFYRQQLLKIPPHHKKNKKKSIFSGSQLKRKSGAYKKSEGRLKIIRVNLGGKDSTTVGVLFIINPAQF